MHIYPREKKWPEFRFRLGIILTLLSVTSMILSLNRTGWDPDVGIIDALLIFPLLFKTLFRHLDSLELVIISLLMAVGGAVITVRSTRQLLQIRREWYDNLPALRTQLERAQAEGTLTAVQEKMLEEVTDTHVRH